MKNADAAKIAPTPLPRMFVDPVRPGIIRWEGGDEFAVILAGRHAAGIVRAVNRDHLFDELVAELQNIANADTSKWEKEYRDDFKAWAQNRCRHLLAKIEAAKGVA